MKKLLKFMIIVFFICLLYKMQFIGIIICLGMALFVSTSIIREEEIRKKYLKRFNDLILYMDQIIYSFKKQPKIRLALMDAQKVCTDEMKEYIEEAILCIDNGDKEDIYADALRIIEDGYGCKRVKELHDFIKKIENQGGNYEAYINMILDDIRQWSDQMYLFMEKVNRIRRNMLISIMATVITCGFMAYLIPKGFSYTSNIIYQIASVFFLCILLLIYRWSEKKLNIDWLKEESAMSDNMVMKYYTLVEKEFYKKKKLKFMEKLSIKKAKKRLEKEIKKEFPGFVREVAINLQNDTVQSSIEKSYEKLSFVLKRPIRKLLVDFEKYPVGIEPYDNFLREFELADLKSSIKLFYSINELGKDKSDGQIQAMIERNNKMMWQAMEMRNNDRIGLTGFMTSIPSLVGTMMLIVQLVLTIFIFTAQIGKVV